MPPIRADLNAGGFKAKEPGDYAAHLHSWKREVSKGPQTKGADVVVARFNLDEGGAIFNRFTILPDFIWSFKQLATAGGVDADILDGEKTIGFSDEVDASDPETVCIDDIMNNLVGEPFVLRLTKKPATAEYDEGNNVKKILPADAQLAVASGW